MTSVLGGGSNARQATAVGSLQFQTSQAGGTIPLVYGTGRVAGNLLDYQDFMSFPAKGAKGKGGGASKSGQYDYSVSLVLGLCQGPVTFFLVWYDKSLCPLEDLPGLSYLGYGPDGQDADPYFVTNHPANALGYSGTAFFSADNYQLNESPALPNFSVECQGPQSGTAANQADANPAKIIEDFLTNPRYGAGFPSVNLDIAGTLADYGAYCDAAGIFLAPVLEQQDEAQQFLADLAKITNSAIVWSGSLLKMIPYGDEKLATSYFIATLQPDSDVVELDTLSATFTAAGLVGSPVTASYQAQPAATNTDTTNYSSVMGGLAQAINGNSYLHDFGITAGIGLNGTVIMLRGAAIGATTVSVTGDGAEIITVSGPFDYSWSPVTEVIYQLGEDDFIVQASSAGSAVGPNPGGAALRQGAGPLTGGFSSDPVAVTRSSPADAMNYVQIECLDRANSYNTDVIEAFDQGSVDLYGVRKDTSLKARAIVDFLGVAPIVARLVLQRDLYYRNTYSFNLGWKCCLLEPMDLVQISDARLGLANLTVRITSITEDEEGTLAVTAEDFFGTPGAVLYPLAVPLPAVPGGVSSLGQSGGTAAIYPSQGRAATAHAPNWAAPAGPVNPPFVFEATPQLLQAQGIAGPQLIAGLAGPGSLWGGAGVYVSLDNASYGLQGKFAGRSVMGVTTADLPALGDSLMVDLSQSAGTLAGVSQAAAAQGISLCALRYPGGQMELLSFTAATLTGPNQYTLTGLYRGLYGTFAIDQPAGAQFLYLGAGAYYAQTMPPQYQGVPLWFKFPSANLVGSGVQPEDEAVPYGYTPTGGLVNPTYPLRVAADTPMAAEARSSTVRIDQAMPIESR